MRNILEEFLDQFGDEINDWYPVSANPNLNIPILRKFINRIDWGGATTNSAVSIDDIETNADLPWDVNVMVRRQDVTTEYILKHLELPWQLDFIINHCRKVNLEVLFNNTPDWNWRDFWWMLSEKPFITSLLLKYPELENWCIVSRMPLTIEFIKKFKDKLYWTEVSMNSSVTCEMIEENPDLPWNWANINYNPNIDLPFIHRHLFYLNPSRIVFNNFLTDKVAYKNRVIKDIKDFRVDVSKVIDLPKDVVDYILLPYIFP